MSESARVLESMCQFIRNHGKEREQAIIKQTQEEFTIEKEKFIAMQKEDIVAAYKAKIKQDEIKMRIEKSARQNKERIEKMRKVNEMVQSLQEDVRVKLADTVKNNKAAYKEILKKLIVQGLIKLMEEDVWVKCRKSDLSLV